MIKEQKRRTVTKAVSYRAGATIATFSIALIFTGNLELATTIGLTDTVVKFMLFYVNERIWIKINWGYSFSMPKGTDVVQKNQKYAAKTRQQD